MSYGKAIRAKFHASQAEFSEVMGTSVDTIKSWETKRRNPTELAAKVLATIQENPAFFDEFASHAIPARTHLQRLSLRPEKYIVMKYYRTALLAHLQKSDRTVGSQPV